jgi:D-sedoheptulose 7-phosphate isomerase
MEVGRMNELLTAEFEQSASVIRKLDTASVVKVADAITSSLKKGGKAIFMGNGGSAADAQHIAAELSGRYLMDRPAMAGMALSNVVPITAIGNDYGYEFVFKRQIESICNENDIVIGLSTSGNSENVILAIDAAKAIGATTVSFTGNGGKLKDIVDIPVIIDSNETPRIQEGYFVACHAICGMVERNMYGPKAVFIDRDDTIYDDVGYCSKADDFNVFDYVPKSIAKLNEAGYLVIVITNQSGINRGYFDLDTLNGIHDKMIKQISAGGGKIDDIFFCPHHPDENCSCRKPEIGMGLDAVKKYKINLRESYMIGDSDRDMGFGERLGCKTIKVTDDFTFKDAVNRILDH